MGTDFKKPRSLRSLKERLTRATYDGKKDQLKGELLPGSKVMPDTAIWLLILPPATEMSEGASDLDCHLHTSEYTDQTE